MAKSGYDSENEPLGIPVKVSRESESKPGLVAKIEGLEGSKPVVKKAKISEPASKLYCEPAENEAMNAQKSVSKSECEPAETEAKIAQKSVSNILSEPAGNEAKIFEVSASSLNSERAEAKISRLKVLSLKSKTLNLNQGYSFGETIKGQIVQKVIFNLCLKFVITFFLNRSCADGGMQLNGLRKLIWKSRFLLDI